MYKTAVEDKSIIRAMIILATIIGLGSLWIWWAFVYTTPTRVFNDMLSNNLSTFGVTRTVSQKQEGSASVKQTQLVLGAQNASRTINTITQTDSQNKDNTVITEIIATPTASFTKYNQIQTNEKTRGGSDLDFTSVLGLWSKQEVESGGQSQFIEALYGLFPFAQLPVEKRNELLQFIEDKKVYTFSEVADAPEAGKNTMVFSVEINMKSYIEMVKKLDELMGLNQLTSVNSAEYEGAEPISTQVAIQKDSRTIQKITYPGGNREDTFEGYGIRRLIDVPTETVPASQIDEKIQKVLGQTN